MTLKAFALTYQVNVFFFYIKSRSISGLALMLYRAKKDWPLNGFNLVFYGVEKISLDSYFHFYSIGLSTRPVGMEKALVI